jgi:ribonuclease E
MEADMMENIAELTGEQLQTVIDEALDAYTALNLSVESSEDDIATAEGLAENVRAARAEITRRAEEAAQRQERIAALDTELAAPEAPEAVEDAPEAPEAAEDAPEAVEAVGEAADDAPAGEPAVRIEAEAPAEEPVPVAASADTNTSPTKRAAANAPIINLPKEAPMVALTAAADVPGFATGATLETFADVGEAVVAAAMRR